MADVKPCKHTHDVAQLTVALGEHCGHGIELVSTLRQSGHYGLGIDRVHHLRGDDSHSGAKEHDGEDDPEEELGKSHECHANYLSEHKFSSFHAANQHFHYLARLFFHDSGHNHTSEHSDEQKDEYAKHHREYGVHAAFADFLVTFFIQHEGAYRDVGLHAIHYLFQSVYVIGSYAIVFEGIVDVSAHSRRHAHPDRLYRSERCLKVLLLVDLRYAEHAIESEICQSGLYGVERLGRHVLKTYLFAILKI